MASFFSRYIPILEWLPAYRKSNLGGDLTAGLTVGVMLIPQGMAYAMIAGLEPIHGLYAVTVPLLLYAIFGSSRQLAVGPVAMVSLLTAAGIASLEPESGEQYLLYALTLAFMVGVLQFGMGLLRLGFVVNFLSHPVISGFTSAAAIIIGLSQFKHLLGIPLPQSEKAQEVVYAIIQQAGDIHLLSLAVGVGAMLILLFSKRIHPYFPAALAAVVFGILLTWLLGLHEDGLRIVGSVPGGLPELSSPTFEVEAWRQLLPIALTISLVGFAESYAVAKAVHRRHKDEYQLDANQELVALGMANFGAAFFQGYPVTGGFSRTAVNDKAGARSNLASLVSATLIVLTLLFLTALFFYLPNAVLAAIVVVAVAGLIDVKEAKILWKRDRSDFFMLLATFVSTLSLGIEVGILTGLVLSLVMVIFRASRPHMAILGRVPGTSTFRNVKRFEGLETNDDLLLVRIDGPIYFANVDYIKAKLDKWVARKGPSLRMIVINMESVPRLDSTGAHAIFDWLSSWRAVGIDVCMSSVKGPVRDVLQRWQLPKAMGEDHFFLDDDTALAAFHDRLDKERSERLQPYTTQVNP